MKKDHVYTKQKENCGAYINIRQNRFQTIHHAKCVVGRIIPLPPNMCMSLSQNSEKILPYMAKGTLQV